MAIPRPEYPRPQLVREQWINLNGTWDFEIDNAQVGLAKKYQERETLDQKITVPFCPESCLSGIGNVDYMNTVWYRKELDIPAAWEGKNILLNFIHNPPLNKKITATPCLPNPSACAHQATWQRWGQYPEWKPPPVLCRLRLPFRE